VASLQSQSDFLHRQPVQSVFHQYGLCCRQQGMAVINLRCL